MQASGAKKTAAPTKGAAAQKKGPAATKMKGSASSDHPKPASHQRKSPGGDGTGQSSKNGPGRVSNAVKLGSKSTDDIINPLGMDTVREDVEKIIQDMSMPPFSTALAGEEMDDFSSQIAELKNLQ